jgi:heme-degrading monooxygenase HmoA
MIVVANRFHVAEEHVEDFEQRFRERMGEVENREGFVRFEFQTPVDHGHVETDTHAAVTYWESMDAFEGWTDSEAFQEAHRNPPPEEWFTADGGLEIREVAFDAGGKAERVAGGPG